MILTFSSLVSAVKEKGQNMAKKYILCVLDKKKFSMIQGIFNFFMRLNYCYIYNHGKKILGQICTFGHTPDAITTLPALPCPPSHLGYQTQLVNKRLAAHCPNGRTSLDSDDDSDVQV